MSWQTLIEDKLTGLDWNACSESLWARGWAQLPPVLTAEECAGLARMYGEDSHFRSHIVMARYRFGSGDYKYFQYPLPPAVQRLREQAYPPLALIANQWHEALGIAQRFSAELGAFLRQCRQAGQAKPTPLLLHYEAGDYNCLHQDIYGEIAFPLQMTIFLSRPPLDYEGGEFVLVEQQPRAQSKAQVVLPGQGEAVVFTTRYRPVKGSHGHYRVNVRHGVSSVTRGTRYTLGIIFHDAR